MSEKKTETKEVQDNELNQVVGGVVLAFGSLFMTGPIRQLVKTDLP